MLNLEFPKFIKHVRNLDVCYEVYNYEFTSDGIELWVNFWNMGQTGNSYMAYWNNFDSHLHINYGNFKNWQGLDEFEKDLRKAEWKNLQQ